MTLRLYIGQTYTGVTVEPDSRWPNMWRVRKGDRLSDMVNLSRAKDASLAWAQAGAAGGLIGHQEVSWKCIDLAAERARMRSTKKAATLLPGAS